MHAAAPSRSVGQAGTTVSVVEDRCLPPALTLAVSHAQERLSPQEMTYAREYFVMMGRAFKDALLDHLPACAHCTWTSCQTQPRSPRANFFSGLMLYRNT